MAQDKLSDYCQTLTSYEWNRLRKYMASPLYNEDERLLTLVELLAESAKKGKEEPAPETLWKKIFKTAPFKRAKYNRLRSDTVKKVEHFLVLDRFREQERMQQNYLLEIMNERKLLKHVPEFMRFTEKKHEQVTLKDAGYYYLQLQLQQQKNLYLENRDERSLEKNIEAVLESADVYYLIQKLKYTAALLHYKNFLSVEAEVPLLAEILQHLKKHTYNVPAIAIYHSIILCFTEADNEAHYQRLSKLLSEHSVIFPTEELKSLFVFAMNYCITKINYGRQEYLKELLLLYKQALANELLMEEGMLSPWDYKNIITTALRVNETQWTEQFMEEYRMRLPRKERHNAYTFNRARLHFYKKQYEKVLELLQNVKYSDIFYQLDSKTTLLKTYYELGEELPLQSLKDSFRILLSRKKLISQQQRENYLNLARLTYKLFRADVKDRKQIADLQKEIESTTNVADKGWLLEKLKEINHAA
ncbi:MAG: hypothetical protein U0V74_01260 [Chitinophagales bacterium]